MSSENPESLPAFAGMAKGMIYRYNLFIGSNIIMEES